MASDLKSRNQTSKSSDGTSLRVLWKKVRDSELYPLARFSIFVTVSSLAVLFFAYFLSVRVVPDISDDNSYWGYLEGFVGLATLAIIIGGLIFTLVGYLNDAERRDSEYNAERINMYKEIFDRLMNNDDIEARRWIIINLEPFHENAQEQLTDTYDLAQKIVDRDEGKIEAPPSQAEIDYKAWLDRMRTKIYSNAPDKQGEAVSGHDYIKHVLNTFDFLGFINVNCWPLEKEFAEWMSPPVAKVWRRIGPYVEWEARARHETEDFYQAARGLGKYCIQWRFDNDRRESEIIKPGL